MTTATRQYQIHRIDKNSYGVYLPNGDSMVLIAEFLNRAGADARTNAHLFLAALELGQ